MPVQTNAGLMDIQKNDLSSEEEFPKLKNNNHLNDLYQKYYILSAFIERH